MNGLVLQQFPLGLSLISVSTLLLGAFSIGALANAGRAFLMRMSGACSYLSCMRTSHPSLFEGQRIVARLRERTYAAALRQEVEFVEKGEGDVLSRLNVDTTIVGER